MVSAGNDQRLISWDRRPFEQPAAATPLRKNKNTVIGLSQEPDGRGAQLQAGHPSSNSSTENGNVAGGGRDPAAMEQNQNAKQHLGKKKKKGRGTKAAGKVRSPGGGEAASTTHSGDTSQELLRSDAGTRDIAMQSTAAVHDANATNESVDSRGLNGRHEYGGRAQAKHEIEEAGGVCPAETFQPLSVMWLEEKPNWVSSTAVPYEALLVTDTSSEVKILRRRGC